MSGKCFAATIWRCFTHKNQMHVTQWPIAHLRLCWLPSTRCGCSLDFISASFSCIYLEPFFYMHINLFDVQMFTANGIVASVQVTLCNVPYIRWLPDLQTFFYVNLVVSFAPHRNHDSVRHLRTDTKASKLAKKKWLTKKKRRNQPETYDKEDCKEEMQKQVWRTCEKCVSKKKEDNFKDSLSQCVHDFASHCSGEKAEQEHK